jgi:YqaJ-like viral recombinase domain
VPPFTGNAATAWGLRQESSALAQFEALAAGVVEVHRCAFRVLEGEDAQGRPLNWIGASPDGIMLPAGSHEAKLVKSGGGAERGGGAMAVRRARWGWNWGAELSAEPLDSSEIEVEEAAALEATFIMLGEGSGASTALSESSQSSSVWPPAHGAQVDSTVRWPHVERHAQGRGLLEIKCPYSLCASSPCASLAYCLRLHSLRSTAGIDRHPARGLSDLQNDIRG